MNENLLTRWLVLFYLTAGLFLPDARGQNFTFGNYQLVSSTRVGRTDFEYVLRVRATNNVADAQGVTAKVFSSHVDTAILENTAEFGNMAFGSSAVSTDTFKIRQNRVTQFNPSSLRWFASVQSMPLTVAVVSPITGLLTNGTNVIVTGTVGPGVHGVTVGRTLATLTGNNFSADVPLEEGRNALTVNATNSFGGLGSDGLVVTRDTSAPVLNIESPLDGAILGARQLTVQGLVNDAVPGTVNPEQAAVKVNGLDAAVLNRSYAISDLLLAPGKNKIQVRARDRAGNESQKEIEVTFQDPGSKKRLVQLAGEAQSGPINATLPVPLVVELVDGNGVAQTNQPVTFTITRNDGTLFATPDSGRTLSLLTDEHGQAQVLYQLGTRSGVANNQVSVTTAGIAAELLFTASATSAPPAKVTALLPETQIGEVSKPLAHSWTALVTDAGGNPVAGVPIDFTVFQGEGGNFNGATTVNLTTDGDGRASALMTLGPGTGVNNYTALAMVPGVIDSSAVFTASGVEPTPQGNTRILGLVLDNANRPMSNILCIVLGTTLATVTDEQGQFVINNAPAGAVRLVADARDRGYPGEWHSLEFNLVNIPGRDNSLDRPIYMLPLDTESKVVAGGDKDVTLHLKGFPGSSLTIKAHSVRDSGGKPVTSEVSWTQVNAERVPMTPPMGSQPILTTAIQPAGLRFDPPARMCVPNTGLPPGQIVELFGFDHDLGSFVSVGTATVSSDGSQVCSDPGFGVKKSGWHPFVPPPPPPTPCLGTPPPCKKCNTANGTFVSDPGQNGSGCDSNGDGVIDGVCQNGTCVPVTEFDPGPALIDEVSIPWTKNGILASEGERMIWNLQGKDEDQKRRKGVAAWTKFTGAGPYEIQLNISGDADWDSANSGSKVKTFNSLTTGNVDLYTKATWGGGTITVTARFRDNAGPISAPDTGSVKDPDLTVTWTIEKRTNCPTSMVTVQGAVNTFRPAPATYGYRMDPDVPPAGRPDYQNQTILEQFQNVTAYSFTMNEVTAAFKTANPTLNTPDKVANFLWNSGGNGTFVVDANDRIYDGHGGFGDTSAFTPAAIAAGFGYILPQTYSCGATVVGSYTITRLYKAGSITISKSGP